MLQAILNKSWKQHPMKQLYSHLLSISKTVQVKQIRHTGHCWRSKDEHINDVLLWTPTHGCTSVGQPARTSLHQLSVGCSLEDLPRAINDRNRWRESQGNPCCQHNLMMMIHECIDYLAKYFVSIACSSPSNMIKKNRKHWSFKDSGMWERLILKNTHLFYQYPLKVILDKNSTLFKEMEPYTKKTREQ